MIVLDLSIGDLFSFRANGAVHMIVKVGCSHFEYKSYNDGKIRVCTDKSKQLFSRKEFDLLFERKWFIL
jgi:hypothetical protein